MQLPGTLPGTPFSNYVMELLLRIKSIKCHSRVYAIQRTLQLADDDGVVAAVAVDDGDEAVGLIVRNLWVRLVGVAKRRIRFVPTKLVGSMKRPAIQ